MHRNFISNFTETVSFCSLCSLKSQKYQFTLCIFFYSILFDIYPKMNSKTQMYITTTTIPFLVTNKCLHTHKQTHEQKHTHHTQKKLTFSSVHYHYTSNSALLTSGIQEIFLHLNRESHVRPVGWEEPRKSAELTALKCPAICQVQQLLVSMATRQDSFVFFAEG